MLEPDPDIRPDIYQVSSVAFKLAGKENPVQNLHVRTINCLLSNMNKKILFIMINHVSQKVVTPIVENLPCPPMESECIKRSSSIKISKSSAVTPVEGTSVTPRQRPKGQNLSTGPINLGGQIVSQLSGQGNQMPPPVSPAGNPVSYVQINQQITPINTPQAFLQPIPSGNQSSFTQVPPHIQSPGQVPSFNQPPPAQKQLFNQPQSPLSSHSPLAQQSPVTVPDKPLYYFDNKQQNDLISPEMSKNEESLEALFPASGKYKFFFIVFNFQIYCCMVFY